MKNVTGNIISALTESGVGGVAFDKVNEAKDEGKVGQYRWMLMNQGKYLQVAKGSEGQPIAASRKSDKDQWEIKSDIGPGKVGKVLDTMSANSDPEDIAKKIIDLLKNESTTPQNEAASSASPDVDNTSVVDDETEKNAMIDTDAPDIPDTLVATESTKRKSLRTPVSEAGLADDSIKYVCKSCGYETSSDVPCDSMTCPKCGDTMMAESVDTNSEDELTESVLTEAVLKSADDVKSQIVTMTKFMNQQSMQMAKKVETGDNLAKDLNNLKGLASLYISSIDQMLDVIK